MRVSTLLSLKKPSAVEPHTHKSGFLILIYIRVNLRNVSCSKIENGSFIYSVDASNDDLFTFPTTTLI